jgi:hypothetical protein
VLLAKKTMTDAPSTVVSLVVHGADDRLGAGSGSREQAEQENDQVGSADFHVRASFLLN